MILAKIRSDPEWQQQELAGLAALLRLLKKALYYQRRIIEPAKWAALIIVIIGAEDDYWPASIGFAVINLISTISAVIPISMTVLPSSFESRLQLSLKKGNECCPIRNAIG
jgi:hypothetical protein